MNETLGWIIFLDSFALFITLYIFLYTVLRRRVAPGAGPFSLLLLMESLWIFGNIAELLAPSLERKLFWDNAQWGPTLLLGPLVVWFVAEYMRLPRPWVRRVAWASGLSAAVIWGVQSVPLLSPGGRPGARLLAAGQIESLIYPYLWSDYLGMAFQYLLILAAVGWLVVWSFREPAPYRAHARIVLSGFIVPILGLFPQLLDIMLGPQRDMSPLLFAVGNLIVAWGLFRMGLFNMADFARAKAVNHMPDPLIVLDSGDRIVDLNPAAMSLFGLRMPDIMGIPAREVLPPSIRLDHFALYQEYQDEIALPSLPEAPSRASPDTRPIPHIYELNLLPVTDRVGQVTGRILVLHDITARKRNEEIQRQIREERVKRRGEEKFRIIIEQIGDGFALVDTEGRVEAWNAAMEAISGIPRAEAMGQFFWDIMDQTTVPERRSQERTSYYRDMVLSTLLTGRAPTITGADRQVQTVGGPRKIIHQSPFPVRIGQEYWIASITRDVTEQRQAQLSLERFAARMKILHGIDQAILAANSTADLCEAALRQLHRLVPYRRAGLGLHHEWIVQHAPEGESGFPVGRLESWVAFFHTEPEENEWDDAQSGLRVLALRFQGSVIGVLYLCLDEPGSFSGEMEEIVRELSAQLAVALRHASLLEQIQRRVEELTHLHEISADLNQFVRRPWALGLLAEKIARLTGAPRAVLFLYDPAGCRVSVVPPAYGMSDTQAARLESLGPPVGGRLPQPLEGGVHINPQTPPTPLAAVLRERMDFQTLLATPLLYEGQWMGGILLADKPGDFTPEDMHLLNVVASQVAAVLLNMRLYEQLATGYEATIAGWSKALELRDKETQGHSRRVTGLSLTLAARLGVKGEDLQHFKHGVLLHDIGKMGIPDSILLKAGPLTDAEREIMRQHPGYAAEMLSEIDYLRAALTVPYSHHERWDGSGYPQGLRGEAIPLWARVFAVVDVWDALTNDRPYRSAWTQAEAVDYLRQNAGTEFDPRIVEAFFDILKELDLA